MEKGKRRSISNLRLEAVNKAVDEMHVRVLVKLRELETRRTVSRPALTEEEMDQIARLLRVLAHDATVEAYNQGSRDGRLRARLELGEAADEDVVAVFWKVVLCPTCRRPVD